MDESLDGAGLSQEQERIHELLGRLVGPGAAAFFHDACEIMAGRCDLHAGTHMVGHALREVESALRKVLVQPGARPKQKGDRRGHERGITAALAALGVPGEHPMAKAWLLLSEEDYPHTLDKTAHRQDLRQPRALDPDFEAFWEQMQELLGFLLEEFEKRFAELVIPTVRDIIGKGPCDDSLKQLKGNVPFNRVAHRYFFDQVNDVAWLAPLDEAGFFSYPAPLEHDLDGSIRFPVWPQSQLLVRTAADHPEEVLDVVLKIPQTDNYAVHEDILEIAERLPAHYAVQLLPTVKDTLGRSFRNLSWERARPIVEKLRDARFIDAAADLAATALGIVDGVRAVSADDARVVGSLLAGADIEVQERHQSLIGELRRRASQPEPVVLRGGSSPLSVAKMREMAVEELADFARTWSPQRPDPFEPSQEGLATAISMLVRAEPRRFATDAGAFIGAPDVHVSGLLEGLDEPLRDGQSLPWEGLLRLCEWAVEQAGDGGAELPEVLSAHERFQRWNMRLGVARLLGRALSRSASGLTPEMQERVWPLLSVLAHDRDSYERAVSHGEEGRRDPATDSLNTVSGAAVHAVIDYLGWVEGHSGEETARRALAEQVGPLLGSLLSEAAEETVEARAALGMRLDHLLGLDPDWVKERRPQLLPADAETSLAWSSLWKSYLSYARLGTRGDEILEEEYRRAVERWGDAQFEKRFEEGYRRRLLEHLMRRLLWGQLDARGEDDLARLFLACALVEERRGALDFAGHELHRMRGVPLDTPGLLSTQTVADLVSLWDGLIFAAESKEEGAQRRDLVPFPYYLASGFFDDEWALDRLESVLALVDTIERPDLLQERLAELAENHPSRVVRCLALLLDNEMRGIIFGRGADATRRALAACLREEESQGAARDLVNRLVAKGYDYYADLLDGP